MLFVYRMAVSSSSDQRIHLWDFYQDDVRSPSFSLRDLKVLHPPFLPLFAIILSVLLGTSILSRIFSYKPVSFLVSLRFLMCPLSFIHLPFFNQQDTQIHSYFLFCFL